MKKATISVVILLVALVPVLALADYNLVQQTTNNANTGSASRSRNQGLGILSPSASITGIDVIINTNFAAVIDLEFCDNADQNQAFNCNSAVHHSSQQNLATGSTAVQHMTFASPVVNSGSKYVYIVWSAGGGVNTTLYGSSANTYADGACYDTVGACANISDAYFAVIASGTQPDSISITSPVNATSTADFGLFQGVFNTASTSSPRFVQVNYGYTTSTMTLHDEEPHTLLSGGVNEAWIVQKTNQIQTGTIYAQASLYATDTLSFTATSSIISFTLTTSGNPYFPTVPNSTSTLADTTISCDPAAGFFANGFCNIVLWAFIPPQADFDNFGNLKTALATKPPFGYFTALNTAISGLSSTASSSVDFGDFSGISFFSDLKTFLAWPLWFLFGWWVYNKFRHFKF